MFDLDLDLRNAVGLSESRDLYLLTDTNSQQYCLSEIRKTLDISAEHILCLPDGEQYKTLETVERIWDFLIKGNATRSSLLLILGGGVLCDMGGFAAATFKRGIPFVNIPTTLLAMVDASCGGKTGFDYQGLKNEIGVFYQPKSTVIYPPFLRTLPHDQLLSGYAEMLKHALIASPLELIHVLAFNIDNPDYESLAELIQRSIDIKQYIVDLDPEETGLRKSLNFGHTVGHALEEYSLSKGQKLLHGTAVMYGIVAELYLSMVKLSFPKQTMIQVVHFMLEHYPKPACACKDYEKLIEFMRHDKKNMSADVINFSLLRQVGNCRINQTAKKEEIGDALDFLFNL